MPSKRRRLEEVRRWHSPRMIRYLTPLQRHEFLSHLLHSQLLDPSPWETSWALDLLLTVRLVGEQAAPSPVGLELQRCGLSAGVGLSSVSSGSDSTGSGQEEAVEEGKDPRILPIIYPTRRR